MKTKLAALGTACLLLWFALAIVPYYLHRQHWEKYQFGQPVPWTKGAEAFYDFYYLLGVIGGWQILLTLGLLSCSTAILLSLQRFHQIACALLAMSILMPLVSAFSNNCENTIMRVLE